jgi:two-component system, cell cycle sensor histidine kinase and response regulator CckA
MAARQRRRSTTEPAQVAGASSALQPHPMLAQLRPEPVELPGSGYTVLVVDDYALVRAVVIRLLLRGGYKVLEASNASETRKFEDLISNGGVDLLLTDVVLTGLNGVELAVRLQTINPQIGVLLMSGMVPDPIMNLLKRFAFPVLEKPFDGPKLLGSVAKVISTLPLRPKAGEII